MKRNWIVVCCTVAAIALAGGVASASTLMLDFGPTTATGANLTNSPLHAESGGSFTDTTWNEVHKADIGSGLLYSDGTAATGVALDLGVSPTSAIDLSTQPGSENGLGATVNTGIYDGDSVATDAVYQTYGSPLSPAGLNQSFVGAQVTGLAEGLYDVYVTGRNTNTTNVSSLGGAKPYSFDGYVGAGAAGNFDVSGYSAANVYFDYGGGTAAWVEEGNPEENYIKFTVEMAAGEALNIAVAGNLDGVDTTDHRGFFNMVQISPSAIPEPSSLLLLGLGLVGIAASRRQSAR